MCRFWFCLVLVLSVAACAVAPIQLDPNSFLVDKGESEPIPRVCKSTYDNPEARVAVVNFTNNTTFDFTRMVQANVRGSSQGTKTGAAAGTASPGTAGVVWGSRENTKFWTESQSIERKVNSKLSESVEDGVTNELVNVGGSRVFTRKDMVKILEEQKFQRSGLVDDTQLVRLGKIAGVQYIITGSVNNVNLAWKDVGAKDMGKYGFLGALTGGIMLTQEGWNITTDIALRILDVETGQILFSELVSGRDIIGKVPYPNYDLLIGGIKRAAAKALEDSRPKLSKWFTIKGYIRQTRTSEDGSARSANVSIGERRGLKPGSKLIVYTFEEMEDHDPRSGQKTVTCNMMKLPVELIVTDQIQADNCWVLMQGNPKAVNRVKKGQLVERMPMEGQGFLKKMGY
jgi:curli biogenesis system outer membrane secretion channel CsgG